MTNDNYPTPDWLMDLFKGYFDPCPLYGEKGGLELDWLDYNYVNPPYSNPSPWVDKAIVEANKGKVVVMLLPVDTSTKWFAKLIEAKAHIFWSNGRIRFTESPPRFASMLVILNKNDNSMTSIKDNKSAGLYTTLNKNRNEYG